MSATALGFSRLYDPVLLNGGNPDEKWPLRKTLFFVLSASLGLWLTILSMATTNT